MGFLELFPKETTRNTAVTKQTYFNQVDLFYCENYNDIKLNKPAFRHWFGSVHDHDTDRGSRPFVHC